MNWNTKNSRIVRPFPEVGGRLQNFTIASIPTKPVAAESKTTIAYIATATEDQLQVASLMNPVLVGSSHMQSSAGCFIY